MENPLLIDPPLVRGVARVSAGIRRRVHVFGLDALNLMQFGVHAPRYAQRIYVDPQAIDLMLLPGIFDRSHTGRVAGGDWDLKVERFEESTKWIYCRRRFIAGQTWEEAGAYRYMRDQIRTHPGYDGCHTEADIVRRFDDLDRTFQQIVREGRLRTRREINESAFRERWGVYVHIDRHGRPVFGRGGHHRLAIAKLAGLRSVPAQLGVVHRHAIHVWSDALATPPTPV